MTVTIDSTTFSNNETTVSSGTGSGGGALYLSTASEAHISNSTFSNNTSKYNGGAIVVNSGNSVTSTFENIEFISNTTSNLGGAMDIRGGSIIELDNITATNNKAKTGGFAYITSANSTMTLKTLVASGNTGTSSAPFMSSGNSTCKIKSNVNYLTVNGEPVTSINNIITGTFVFEEIEFVEVTD